MTAVKNYIKIVGYGTHLPRNTVTFKDQTRYRVVENEETQLSMAVKAIEKALQQAGLTIKNINAVCAVAAALAASLALQRAVNPSIRDEGKGQDWLPK